MVISNTNLYLGIFGRGTLNKPCLNILELNKELFPIYIPQKHLIQYLESGCFAIEWFYSLLGFSFERKLFKLKLSRIA